MRRSKAIGAASAAALAPGSLAVSGGFGSSHREAPKILTGPDGRQHRRLRLHGEGRPGQPDHRRQLDPVRGAGRRAVLRQARSEGPVLRQDRQHRRRASRTSPTGGSSGSSFRNPNSFLVRGARRSPRSTIRTSTSSRRYDLYRRRTSERRAQAHQADRARRAGRARQHRPEDDPELRPVATGAIAPVKGGGKTFVGPIDDPFFLDLGTRLRRHQHRQAGPARTSASATRAAARTTSPATTRTAFVLQVPESEVTRDGKSVKDAKSSNAVVGVWATTERRQRAGARARRRAGTASAAGCRSRRSATR